MEGRRMHARWDACMAHCMHAVELDTPAGRECPTRPVATIGCERHVPDACMHACTHCMHMRTSPLRAWTMHVVGRITGITWILVWGAGAMGVATGTADTAQGTFSQMLIVRVHSGLQGQGYVPSGGTSKVWRNYQ